MSEYSELVNQRVRQKNGQTCYTIIAEGRGFFMLLQFLRPRPFVVDTDRLFADYEIIDTPTPAPRTKMPANFILPPELAFDEVREAEQYPSKTIRCGKLKDLAAKAGVLQPVRHPSCEAMP